MTLNSDNLEDLYPLSPMQQGMLFHTAYEHESGTYFEQSVFTLEGELDVASFERAWQFLVDRHPILRSSFMWDLERPLQVVHREVAIKIHEEDWRDQPPERHGPHLQQYLAEDRRRGFDLSTAPLIRLALFRTADTTYKFVFSRHHIVLDRWSRSIVLKEVFEAYESLCAGREPQLDRPRPYGDYISWITDQPLEDAESYWRAELTGFSNPTPIAIDPKSVNASRQGGEFADERIQLSEESTARLSEFARAHKLTLSTLMQGAWALLLSTYAREQDVLFGVTVSGRSAPLSGIESMVGLFINTLPLRVKLSGDSKIPGWLQSLQEQQFALQQYEYCSLLDIQSWGEVPRGTPLFETILVFENLPVNIGSKTANGNLKVQSDRSYGSVTGYPLTLLAMPGHRFALQLVYDRARFDSETVSRMLTHLQTVLEELVVDHPERRLSEISVLRSEQKQQLLFDWNQTSTDYEKDVCVHQLIERQAALRPTAIAATFQDRELTYAELNARANQLARYLRSLGVGPETLVGICVERSLEMLVGVLGILKAGGAYVPLDPTFPLERLAFMIEDSDLPVLLTQESLLAELPSTRAKMVVLDAEWDHINQNRGENFASTVTADNLAYVIYTSGSTGKSKGVEVGHRALTNFLFSMQEPGIGPNDVLLAVTTLSFDIAGLELYLPLISGARVALVESEVAADGIQLKERIAGATLMQATPATWQMLINSGWQGQPGLKVLCGGEALSRELANELLARGVTLWNMYGPTETTIWSTTCRIEGDGPITIGRPIANTQVYLLDEHHQPVPIGVAGELHIGGDGLARGYLNRPQLTAEKFIPNPFSEDPDSRLYKTGDLARYLANGEIEYLGRIDHQVKIRGFRIELGEIESVLRQHASVRETVVLAREDIEGDRRLVAYVIPERRQQDVAVNDASQAEQVSHWRDVWDSTYTETAASVDPAFNIAGWNSSYTGEPIPAAQMREWVDQTVARILSLRPRHVLEIGCGTGLLLFRLAPHVVHYHGTDLSKPALDALSQQLSGAHDNVTLTEQTADDFTGINTHSFDTVILNSVAQYFPSVDYFVRVLEGAFKCLKPGGSIFLGDLRSLPLLSALHASVEVHTAPASLAVSELQRRAQKRIAQEKELVIDPALFTVLRNRLPQISHVNVLLKRGRYHNELTKFRYDVTLRIGDEPVQRVEQPWLDWQIEELKFEDLRRILTTTAPEILAIRGVPDARLASDFRALNLLEAKENLATAGELRETLKNRVVEHGIEPEEFWALSNDLPYEVELTWAGPAGEATFDVILRKRSTPYVEIVPEQDGKFDGPLHKYANDPLLARVAQTMQGDLRRMLARQLPEYMTPSDFIFLNAFPLTPNGKVNRAALPAPSHSRPELEQHYVAPRTAIEKELARIWSEVLRKERVGAKDNFFEIGGHSLLATQVISRIRQHFKVELGLRSMFESPTVETLAAAVAELQQNNKAAASPIISRRRRGVSAKIEKLSSEEVDSLLAEVLSQTDLKQ